MPVRSSSGSSSPMAATPSRTASGATSQKARSVLPTDGPCSSVSMPMRPQAVLPDDAQALAERQVFLSYSRKDKAFAGKLCDAIIALGYDAFLDTKDILP